jgi:WD40 repeat protein
MLTPVLATEDTKGNIVFLLPRETAKTRAMASTLTETAPAATKMVLTPVTTLKDHEDHIRSMSYFPDGKRMISASDDLTVRHWDLQTGKEIKEARDVCTWEVRAVMVSRDGRWVIVAGGDDDHGELKACEVETGITKIFLGHSGEIKSIDISSDGTLLASGSEDDTMRIWVFGTAKLMAGPFEGGCGAVRFSQDSKKLALYSNLGNGLDVWDVRTQKLQAGVQGKAPRGPAVTYAPVSWTSKGTIVAAFNFTDDGPMTIYEFDATSTLETVGASFKGHTEIINALALSSDDTLLSSASRDDTIKLWDFESRQLLASFHVQNPRTLIFSPDSRKLAYTIAYKDDNNIYICNTPVDILTSIGRPAPEGQPTFPTVRLLTSAHVLSV